MAATLYDRIKDAISKVPNWEIRQPSEPSSNLHVMVTLVRTIDNTTIVLDVGNWLREPDRAYSVSLAFSHPLLTGRYPNICDSLQQRGFTRPIPFEISFDGSVLMNLETSQDQFSSSIQAIIADFELLHTKLDQIKAHLDKVNELIAEA